MTQKLFKYKLFDKVFIITQDYGISQGEILEGIHRMKTTGELTEYWIGLTKPDHGHYTRKEDQIFPTKADLIKALEEQINE